MDAIYYKCFSRRHSIGLYSLEMKSYPESFNISFDLLHFQSKISKLIYILTDTMITQVNYLDTCPIMVDNIYIHHPSKKTSFKGNLISDYFSDIILQLMPTCTGTSSPCHLNSVVNNRVAMSTLPTLPADPGCEVISPTTEGLNMML